MCRILESKYSRCSTKIIQCFMFYINVLDEKLCSCMYENYKCILTVVILLKYFSYILLPLVNTHVESTHWSTDIKEGLISPTLHLMNACSFYPYTVTLDLWMKSLSFSRFGNYSVLRLNRRKRKLNSRQRWKWIEERILYIRTRHSTIFIIYHCYIISNCGKVI